MINIQKIKIVPWYIWIFWINVALILATGIFPYVKNHFLKWEVVNHFNLAGEMDFAVWWSGGLLLLCGVLSYQNSTRDQEAPNAWKWLAICFTFLSFDELSSIHERVGNLSAGNYILLGAALIGGVIYSLACWHLWKTKQNPKGVKLIIIGAILFSLAAPNEYIEHMVAWPDYLEGPRISFEEGMEIFGMLICLGGITAFQNNPGRRGTYTELTHNAKQSPLLSKILIAMFLLHIGISWISTHYITVGYRGNPSVWYFTAVFFLLALSYGFVASKTQSYNLNLFRLLAFYFLLLSVGSVYFIEPRPDSVLHRLWNLDNPKIFLGILLVISFTLYYFLFRRVTWKAGILFLTILVSLLISFFVNDPFTKYVVTGYFALIIAVLFLPKRNDEPNF